MALLLDTHALIWWALDLPQLGRRAHSAILGGEPVFVSAVSAFEIAMKHRLGTLPDVERLIDGLDGNLEAQGFVELAVTLDHTLRAGRLPGGHRDPFDRMLIAQAQAEGLAVVTRDGVFGGYGVACVW